MSPRTCVKLCPDIEADERTVITGLLVSADFCCAAVSKLDTKSATKEDTVILEVKIYKQFKIITTRCHNPGLEFSVTFRIQNHTRLGCSNRDPLSITRLHKEQYMTMGV